MITGRHRRRRRRSNVPIALAATLLVVLCAFCALWLPGQIRSSSRRLPTSRARNVRTEVSTKQYIRRPVHRYSVIPGGAYSPGELIAALESNQVVASHYGDFDRTHLRVTEATSTRSVYVSYRLGNAIYWTRHPIQLNANETLLTDGRNFMRARCGNRISDVAQEPVSIEEPTPEELDSEEPPEGIAEETVAGTSDPVEGRAERTRPDRSPAVAKPGIAEAVSTGETEHPGVVVVRGAARLGRFTRLPELKSAGMAGVRRYSSTALRRETEDSRLRVISRAAPADDLLSLVSG